MDRVALVTGASRGIGRGIAQALGEAGATVYVSGRTAADLERTAREVDELGGRGVAHPCDHRDDAAVAALFARIASEAGRLDVLANAVWGGYERMVEGGEFTWSKPYWEQPFERFDAMFAGGLRAEYVASAHAARLMVPRRRGLIAHVGFFAARKYIGNAAYGVAKAATDRLVADTAHELRAHGVAVISLWPGMVRTERVLEAAAYLDLSNSESPRFTGRAVAALAADPHVMEKSGSARIVAELAQEYGFRDVDGSQPRPLTLEQV